MNVMYVKTEIKSSWKETIKPRFININKTRNIFEKYNKIEDCSNSSNSCTVSISTLLI